MGRKFRLILGLLFALGCISGIAAAQPVTSSKVDIARVGGVAVTSTVPVSGSVGVTGSVGVSGTAAVTQSGTWTVQPGNTANTTAWKVDGSAVTQPVSGSVGVSGTAAVTQSGTWTVQPGNTANTTAWKVDGSAVTQPVSGAVGVTGTVGVSGTAAVAGDVASAASDSGNPVKIGAQARTTNPTAVTDAQRVNLIADKLGKLITVPAIRDLKGVQKTTITSSASETTIVTSVASTFLDLYGLIIANTSSTVASCDIKDATSGTTRTTIRIPANDTKGFLMEAGSAIPQASSGNNWTATCTSVASLEITALYVKNL